MYYTITYTLYYIYIFLVYLNNTQRLASVQKSFIKIEVQ